MHPKTEQHVRRWHEQRWLLDAIVAANGVEWDQPRLNYTMFPCGPDAFGDFRGVGMRVKKFADMHREFAAAGRRRERRASEYEAQGRLVSARESYFIAALLYSAARWPIFETNATSSGYNDRMIACFDKYIAYAPRPTERIEVPFGASSLPAYLHLPREPQPGERFPCVIGIDGMDASKEIMTAMYGDKFLERGFASFAYDGPGQGECTFRNLFVTERNHADAALAVYDVLARHPHVDLDRLVITGVSFGSFFGLQAAAALGERVRGAALAFVCHESGMNTIFNMASPSFKLRFMYMAGYEDEAAFDRFIAGFTTDAWAPEVRCPVLIQGGEDDELSPIGCSDELADRLAVPTKLVVFEGERHAIGGNNLSSALGENWLTMMADWCRDRVDGKPAPAERTFIDGTGQARPRVR